MQFSDEELIAYLLRDATDALAERIEQQLKVSPELLARLNEFRIVLEQIDSLGGRFEPPADLVDGTLARIDALADSPTDLPPDNPQPVDAWGESSPQSGDVGSTREAVFTTNCSGFSDSSPYRTVRLNARAEVPPRRSSFWDSTALTVSLTILCCLALPALVRVRFESRKAQCARNLTETGSELIQYALNQPGGRFPHVALDGPAAFAGVYAVYLRDSGANLTPAQLHCASLIGSHVRPVSPAGAVASARTIPSLSQLHQVAARELADWQQTIGGDYAYNLGVVERGTVVAPKCEGSSYFAILADAPMITVTGDEAGQGVVGEAFVAHEGEGINIFYEDGRVVFVTVASLHQPAGGPDCLQDNPLCNLNGAHEVGLHSQDASLAPSHFPPLGR